MIRLGDIHPNPFRNIDRYPIDREKIEALKASINRTSFWNNVVGRATDDGAELGYGHHRLVALNELYGPDHEIDLIIMDLDDEAMLHVMADENMQEWGHKGPVIIETVRAVRDFLLATAPRQAGGNQHGNGTASAASIAEFLGWPPGRIERALTVILGEEEGDLTPEDTAGLSLEHAFELRQSISHITKPEVKRKAIERVRAEATKPKSEGAKLGYRGVRDVVNQVRSEAYDDAHRQPAVPAEVAKRLYADIEGYWRATVLVNGQPITRSELLRLIAEMRNSEELIYSVRPWADQLADALDSMATEANRLAELLRAEQTLAIGATV